MNAFYGVEEARIREYARLLARTGVNVQPGQEIVINCPAEHIEFARLVAEEAYAAGAREVIMRWSDSGTSRLMYQHAAEEALAGVPEWQAESYNYYARRGAGQISISGSDPEAYKGVDPKRMQLKEKAMNQAAAEHYRRLMASENPWTVGAVPQKKWAAKVFPGLSEEEAMSRLWELLLKAVRIDGGDAVRAWEEHDRFLKGKCRMLNAYAFTKLHYKNSMGTDFTVGLAKGHIWEGGSEKSGAGVVFEANMPTEEIFTMPDCRVAEGTLVGAMPLSCRGNLIRDFSLTFHEGQVVEYTAKEGLDALRAVLETDEGSRRLGEVAIVPFDSPISQMKTLFYNTLFDENASCHFALGRCYPTTVAGGAAMSEEELAAHGGNKSANHVDFMVGTADLRITGIRDNGEEIRIFENGSWVE